MKPILLTTLAAAAWVAGCGVNGREDTSASGASTNGTPVNVATTVAPKPIAVAATGAPPVTATAAAGPVAPAGVQTGQDTAAVSPSTLAAPAANPAIVLPKPPPELPGPVQEVVRLAQTSVEEDVIVAYIERNPEPVRLNVDQIIHLRDMGLSMKVIQALIKHDSAVVAGTNPTNAPVQNVLIQQAPPTVASAPPATLAQANSAAPQAAPPAGPQNVLLTNYLASTAAGPANGAPTIPNAPVAPAAPVYQPGPTPVLGAAPVVVEQAPQAVPSTTYFYESLSPYGSWVNVSGYGWCWQPSVAVVNTTWRPYCDDGHWLWTDNGWYWQSNYSWGWAAFHYGRWHRHHVHGWVWYPGTVWGPAWVTWRYSDSYCGWAPLPPEAEWDVRFGLCFHGSRVSLNFGWGLGYDHFSCVSFSHFHHREVWRHCAPRERNVTIINNTTIINNYGTDRHSVVNHGVDKAVVERHSRDEIRKVDIRDTTQPSQASHIVKEGDRPVAVNAFRPTLASQAAAPPARILERQQAARPAASSGSGVATGGVLPSRPSAASGLTPTPVNASRPAIQEPSPRAVTAPAPSRSIETSRPAQPAASRPETVPSRQEANRNVARPESSGRPQYQSPQAPPSAQPAPISRPVGSPSPSRPLNSAGASISGGDTVTASRSEVRKPEPGPSARSNFGSGAEQSPSSAAPLFRPEASGSPSYKTRPATVTTPSTRSDVVRPAAPVPSAPAYRESTASTPNYSAPVPRSAPTPSPSYSAPTSRSAPAPSPSYSAPTPRSAPAASPSYSAPVTRSAPVQSAPAPSRSEGGGGHGGGNRPSRSTREN